MKHGFECLVHELYELGHLYEAAAAHYQATGKRSLLEIALKSADLLDRTFGPEVRFLAIPPGMKPNRPPSDGFQFFGLGRIDRRTKALTMQIRNRKGDTLFSIELPAE